MSEREKRGYCARVCAFVISDVAAAAALIADRLFASVIVRGICVARARGGIDIVTRYSIRVDADACPFGP